MEARAKRNSNIEIIKLVAVFLIILSSALPYGATYRGGGGTRYRLCKFK